MDNERVNWTKYGICIGFIGLNIFISVCITIIYAKTKTFHSYPCYFNIIFSIFIALDNICRLIVGFDKDSIICFIQGFSLVLFDKLMLFAMTIYSLISFLGIVKLDFYRKNEKCIFISSILICIIISLVLTILFMLNGAIKYDDICYARSQPDKDHKIIINKELIDGIVTFILFIINIICILYLLIFVFEKIREGKKSKKKNLSILYFHFFKFLLTLILNSATFILVILIILDKIDFGCDENVSLVYVILSLLIILLYTINQAVLHEIKKILCCIKDDTQPNGEDEEDNALEIGNVKEGMLTGN